MRIEDFDYYLPKELIAQFPAPKRDDARLMVLRRETGQIHHNSQFSDLVNWLAPGDLLVMNDTKVMPARLKGRKISGGRVEVLICEPILADGTPIPLTETSGGFRESTWWCLVRSRGKLLEGMEIIFNEKTRGVLCRLKGGRWGVRFSGVEDIRQLMDEVGEMPLPPYIRRGLCPMDRDRYQTLFASKDGSIAAPTAGLHFTHEMLERLAQKEISWISMTLQVGAGTFLPVKLSRVEDHSMHPEYVEVDEECCKAWHETRSRGGRIIGVGTTTVRAMESAFQEGEGVAPFHGFTSLFIYPGHKFRAVDALITNFHLPRSTLLMLVMAMGGMEHVRHAYHEAIRKGYRFYSYGDAMLIQ